MTRPRLRLLHRTLASVAVAGACSISLAVPVLAAGPDDPDALAATSACASTATGSSPVNPFNGTAPCASGPTSVQEKYEAAIAGAGILVFAGSTLVYRRRRGHPGQPLGRRAPQS